MNPPTRNRLTASGVRLATVATVGMPVVPMSSHAGASSARKAATTRWVTAIGMKHLATDSGAPNDVANRQTVHRNLVCQCERCVPKPGADPLRTGIGTVRACCHVRSLDAFIDK